ncbi:MAG: glutaredoxin domain-containing protein [Thermodesulfovibrionales bacterium]
MVSQDTPRVELYVTSWCPYCKKAIDFFQAKGIPVTVYDIEQDAAAARRKDQLDSRRGVPFAVINGQQIHGYSADAYQRALDRR